MMTAPEAVARTATRSPGLMPAASRTPLGRVTCPFTVTVVVIACTQVTPENNGNTNGGQNQRHPRRRTARNLDLSGAAHVLGPLAQIGDQRPDVVIVLREK